MANRTTYRVTGMVQGYTITRDRRVLDCVATVNEVVDAISPQSAATAAYNRTVFKTGLVKAFWVGDSVQVNELSEDDLMIEGMETYEKGITL